MPVSVRKREYSCVERDQGNRKLLIISDSGSWGDGMGDLVRKQSVIDAVMKYCMAYDLRELLADIDSLQPEPSEVARDIATIIENEKDMRVILKNNIGYCEDCNHRYKITIDVFPNMEVYACDFMTGVMNDDDYCSKWKGKEP